MDKHPCPPAPPEMYLAHLTRETDGMRTRISLRSPRYDQATWLLLRAVSVHHNSGTNVSTLRSRLGPGAITDFEHSSAIIVSLDLVGVEFEFHDNGRQHFVGWIRGDTPEGFRVPAVGYDPFVGQTACPTCKGKERHMMVSEGRYIPPVNLPLWEQVRGWRVIGSTGPDRG